MWVRRSTARSVSSLTSLPSKRSTTRVASSRSKRIARPLSAPTSRKGGILARADARDEASSWRIQRAVQVVGAETLCSRKNVRQDCLYRRRCAILCRVRRPGALKPPIAGSRLAAGRQLGSSMASGVACRFAVVARRVGSRWDHDPGKCGQQEASAARDPCASARQVIDEVDSPA